MPSSELVAVAKSSAQETRNLLHFGRTRVVLNDSIMVLVVATVSCYETMLVHAMMKGCREAACEGPRN